MESKYSVTSSDIEQMVSNTNRLEHVELVKRLDHRKEVPFEVMLEDMKNDGDISISDPESAYIPSEVDSMDQEIKPVNNNTTNKQTAKIDQFYEMLKKIQDHCPEPPVYSSNCFGRLLCKQKPVYKQNILRIIALGDEEFNLKDNFHAQLLQKFAEMLEFDAKENEIPRITSCSDQSKTLDEVLAEYPSALTLVFAWFMITFCSETFYKYFECLKYSNLSYPFFILLCKSTQILLRAIRNRKNVKILSSCQHPDDALSCFYAYSGYTITIIIHLMDKEIEWAQTMKVFKSLEKDLNQNFQRFIRLGKRYTKNVFDSRQ